MKHFYEQSKGNSISGPAEPSPQQKKIQNQYSGNLSNTQASVLPPNILTFRRPLYITDFFFVEKFQESQFFFFFKHFGGDFSSPSCTFNKGYLFRNVYERKYTFAIGQFLLELNFVSFPYRTGTIAKKRQKRMLDEGDEAEVQKPVVDTYDTLVEKRKNLESSIETTEKQIKDAVEALNEAKKLQQSDNDDLDAYMATLSKTDKGHGGKENVSRLRQLLQTQQIEVNLLFHSIHQGLLYTWTSSLGAFLPTFVTMKISKNDSNIICRSSKNITFLKIWRLWLKN